MVHLDRLQIKTRMILAFVIVVSIFVLFGLFTIRELNTLGGLTRTLYEHPLRVSNAALAARLNVLRMHRSMKDIVLSDTPFELENDIHAVRDAEKMVYIQLDIVKQYILGREGKELERLARTTFLEWRPIRTEVIDLVMQGHKEAATVISKTRSADHVNLLEARMQDLSAYARAKADGFMGDAEKEEREILANTIVFITLTALFSSVIAYLLISSILASIMTLKNKMSDITTTGDLSTATLPGRNEMTDMAMYFNKLIERLKGQLWLKDGQNELNMELSGQRAYDALAAGSINYLSRYVGACSGALYGYDDQTKRCELKASYALMESASSPRTFNLGEGIVGQVALEKKPILLRNITGETALVRTGTRSVPPLNIYALPLIYEDQLYGVLEVASFESLNGIKQEFLDAASQTLATYFYAVSQQRKIDRLLLDTQEANEKLKLQAMELQVLNRELHKHSEELHNQNLTLENQRKQVEEANRLKSEFLSNMSHELRTPLNSINALSHILLLQTRSHLSEEEANYLEIIERNGKHLLSLINNILDLSKIEAGKADLHLVRFSLKSLLESMAEGMAVVAEEKGIELAVHIPADLPWIESDEARVHQIVQNIIGNAVKFTEQGRVTLTAFHDAHQVSIRVEDTGVGISENQLPFIFEEFRQGDGSLSRRYEGTGLGLAIAYKAAQLIGGDIQVSSTSGRGSIFTITLPLNRQGLLPEAGLEPAPVPPPEHRSTNRKTILVIDDNPSALQLISDPLVNLGYEVITAGSGKEGLCLARQHQPFAITLDVIMSEMDGWEVLQTLKKNPDTADIPVIIISRVQDRKVAFALGAIEYITKPVNPNELISVIYQISGSQAHKLLIVDDNQVDRLAIAQAVAGENVEVHFAESGPDCLNMLDKITPDLVVLDLMMPGMDGFEVLEKIRMKPHTKDLPVIIATAKSLSFAERDRLKGKSLSVLPKNQQTAALLVTKLRNALDHLEPGPSAGGRPLILIVEDNMDNLTTVKAIIKNEYDVIEAVDGAAGLEKIMEYLPDLVLLDMSLPKMDGIEVVKAVKKNERTQKIPVIALTAHAMKGHQETFLSAGCDDYLPKPVDPERLLRKIQQRLPKPTSERK